jgi:hypothetical protein
MTTFAAQVEGFRTNTLKNLRYVAINAIQDVVEAAQTPQPGVKKTGGTFIVGRIPVGDTSALIKSLSTGINGSAGSKGQTSYIAVLAGLDVGDVITFEWTMPYALRIEKGFVGTDSLGRTYNQAGRHFVGANAARFQDFVSDRVREVAG